MIDITLNSIRKFLRQNRLLVFLIVYVISPIDLLSEFFFGIWGLIDDFIAILIFTSLIFTKYFLKNFLSENFKTNQSIKKTIKHFEYEDAEFTVIKENKSSTSS